MTPDSGGVFLYIEPPCVKPLQDMVLPNQQGHAATPVPDFMLSSKPRTTKLTNSSLLLLIKQSVR
jgi:hypothetical protein